MENEIIVPEIIEGTVQKKSSDDAQSQPNFLDIIERLASNPNVDVEKIQRIMDMQEQIIDREAKREFNAAMVQAQMEMPVVEKQDKNSQTNTMYAGYADIVKKCQPIYTKHGFAITFYQGLGTAEDPIKAGCNRIMADVMHSAGYTKIVHADIPVETTGIKGTAMMTQTHATGSSFSYGRSYLLRLIFNIPTGDDDDGNSAGGIKYISEGQIATIKQKITEKAIDINKFLTYMVAESVDKIKESDFGKAITALNASKGKQAPVYITAAQKKMLEAVIGKLGFDRSLVKEYFWLLKLCDEENGSPTLNKLHAAGFDKMMEKNEAVFVKDFNAWIAKRG